MSDTTLPQNSILPSRQPEERPLLFIMTVMAFLTGLTLLITLMGFRLNAQWQSDLKGSMTVQILHQGDADIDMQVRQALDILRQEIPQADITALSENEAETLLKPWLGNVTLPDDLPIPQIIQIDRAQNVYVERLQMALASANINADIDDHSRWQNNIGKSWSVIRIGLLGIIIIIFSASVFVSSYATQSVLRARQNIIDVLSHVGARHRYVAKLFIWRFLSLGLKGSFMGCVFAFLVLVIFTTLMRRTSETTLSGLYPSLSDLLWLGVVALVLGLISAFTAGYVTLSKLRRDHFSL